MKLTLNFNSTHWKKQLESLAPQIRTKVSERAVNEAVARAKTRLEADMTVLSGEMKGTIKSGAEYRTNVKVNQHKTIKEAYVGWVRMGDADNPATPYEQGHQTPRKGAPKAHKTKRGRKFYPVMKLTSKWFRSAINRYYNQMLKTMFK